MVIEFVVPGHAVPCPRPRVVRQPGRRVRTIMPKEIVEYESRVALVGLSCRPTGWPLTARRYRCDVVVYRDARRGDGDNFLKSVLDGLEGVLWKNDNRVTKGSFELLDVEANQVPHTEVRAEVLEA